MRLHRFYGGMKLPEHKAESTAAPIRACPLPPRLSVPLLQHAGSAAEPTVEAGQSVRRGQTIGRVTAARGSDVHAPASGTVVAVVPRPLPHPPGLETLHVEIEPDGSDDTAFLPPLDWENAPREDLLARLREAGVVGLGGAGFPTAEKVAVAREMLILNGAECEPYIACDDRLLRERADEVLRGGLALRRLVGAGRTILAIEDTMREAAAAARAAIDAAGEGEIELAIVPTRYPEGGERQLIQVLTGREVPQDGLPRDIGVIVQNVATVAAAWRAIAFGEPLTRRIVTVTGRGVRQPGNYEVAIGTPVSHLIAQAGGYTDAAARLLLGGPMMGLALPNDGFPITKTCNCVLVLSEADVLGRTAGEQAPELPCIRCGACADVCPARLLPQQLLWDIRAERFERASDDGLFDCIECGCCDLACPSHIPLVRHFLYGKAEIRHRDREAAEAAAAKERFEARKQRLEREEAERAERQAARKAQVTSSDAVAAAIERARARRQSGPKDSDA